jgi:non-ribosomal peptide synthetase component E (peptide arylation enzyme)/aryl carrier-like protein
MFGITETTVHVTALTLAPADCARWTGGVGRPIPGWSVTVRDPGGRVLPPGAAGEIWVGGQGVALGYLGRPELTAERFVADELAGGVVYRSGDRGRLRLDGSLDHLGRLDNQVKIRGYRIELDEIRSVLAGDPDVEHAVVTLGSVAGGDSAATRIDAYVVLKPGATTKEVLRRCTRVLPEFMVPATLTAVEAMPLTLNGKVDLGRLPPPLPAARSASQRADDLGSDDVDHDGTLLDVLDLWSEHLQTDVRAVDNFFELGGNSLLVVRLLADVRTRGLGDISPADFYRNSTAAAFAQLVKERRATL